MVQTFNTNSSNDIFIDGDGKLSIASGLQGVLKACETASYAQLGEMVLATSSGIPNFQAIWVGVPNYALWELYLRDALLNVDGVQSVQSIAIAVSGSTLSYDATIATDFGSGIISGSFPGGNQ